MAGRKSLITRFLSYIKIPSVSKDERDFADLIITELRTFTRDVYEDNAGEKIGGNCGNVYALIKGNIPGAPTILFNAHMDTVATKKIKHVFRGDKIFSDGTSILGADNKAGVAVIMELLATLKEKRIPHGDIRVVFTVAEEVGLMGANHLEKKRLKAKFGIAVDGGELNIILNAAPSQDSINAIIHGEAAHAGIHPEAGINAIKIASEAITNMKIGRIDKETTSNIGVIKGGVATNIIPDLVEVKGEARSHNPIKLKNQIIYITSEFKKSCKKYRGKLEYSIDHVYKAFYVSPMRILGLAAKKLGIKIEYKKTGGGSDANILNAFGIPTVIMGVGARGAHTKKEHVSISSMEKGVRFFTQIVMEIAHEKRKTY